MITCQQQAIESKGHRGKGGGSEEGGGDAELFRATSSVERLLAATDETRLDLI